MILFKIFQPFEINLVKGIQKISTPFLDAIFKTLTLLGDVYVIGLVFILLYWLYDSKQAIKVLISILTAAIFNQALKSVFKRNRPFDYIGGEGSAKSIGEKTSGMSFPSGHSQTVTSISYTVNETFKESFKYQHIALIAVVVVVMFSRLYLGQHYLTDVLVGSILGLLITHYTYKYFYLFRGREHKYLLMAVPVLLLLMFIKDKYLYIGIAGYSGVSIGHYINVNWIKYEAKDKFLNQVFKLFLGLLLVGLLAVTPFLLLKSYELARWWITVFVVAISATSLAPYIFTKVFKH